MNIFFDVDYTILGSDNSLRPGIEELFALLTSEGHRIYVWSGYGERQDVVEHHGLGAYVSGVFNKPVTRYRESLSEQGLEITPDLVVDDFPGIVSEFGGVCVDPYYGLGHRYKDDGASIYMALQEAAR